MKLVLGVRSLVAATCRLALLTFALVPLAAGISPALAETDLGVSILTSNATPLNGGAAFLYTVTVTNHGPDAATNVLVVDALPPGIVGHNVSVVNAPSVAGFGLTCVAPPTATNGTITCRGSMPAPVGMTLSTATISIVVSSIPGQAAGVRTNTATVTSDTQEASPNTNPNTASVQVNLQVNAPLSVSMSGPADFTRGSNVVYKMALNNGGQTTALNATIEIELPGELTFVSLFGTGPLHDGCHSTHDGKIRCDSIDVPSGLYNLTFVAKSSPNTPLGSVGVTADLLTAGTGSISVGTSTTNATVNP